MQNGRFVSNIRSRNDERSDEETSSVTTHTKSSSYCYSTDALENDTAYQGRGSKTLKRKADLGGIDHHNIISPSPRTSIESSPEENGYDEPLMKRHRFTRGHGRKSVSYDMKHHPMDDVLWPRRSTKRRGIMEQGLEGSCDKDGGEEEKLGSSSNCRRSSRDIHQSENPVYSAQWHPLDAILKPDTSFISLLEVGQQEIRKSVEVSSTPKDEGYSTIVHSDVDLDEKNDDPSPSRCRSARWSSKDALAKYSKPIHQQSI